MARQFISAMELSFMIGSDYTVRVRKDGRLHVLPCRAVPYSFSQRRVGLVLRADHPQALEVCFAVPGDTGAGLVIEDVTEPDEHDLHTLAQAFQEDTAVAAAVVAAKSTASADASASLGEPGSLLDRAGKPRGPHNPEAYQPIGPEKGGRRG